uniref:Signal transduction histidine kinase, LytS n=1 Tax=Sphingobacterium sp. (strain 21) TaxID=743722 RepID=F4C944_SPHS2
MSPSNYCEHSIRLLGFYIILSVGFFAQAAMGPMAYQKELDLVDSLLQKKDYEQAKSNLYHLLQRGQTIRNNGLIGRSYMGLGSVLLQQGKPDSALSFYLKSMNYLLGKQHAKERASVFINLGTLYSQLKQFSLAEHYLQEALTKDLPAALRLKCLSNLAGVYFEQKKRKEALLTFQEALHLAKKQKNQPVEAILYTNLSNFYIKEKAWDQSIEYAKISLSLRESLHQAPSVITLNNLGYALIRKGEFLQGVHVFKKALPYASLPEKKQLYYNLYTAYKSMGSDRLSWKAIEAYDNIKDSLASLDYQQKVAALTAAYQSAEKQRKIEQLARENAVQKQQLRQQLYLIFAVCLIVILMIGLIVLRWRNLKVKQQLETAILQRRFLLLQLNPHFIFNALQSVQQYIYRNNSALSMQYLSSFSRLIRLVLENSDKELISLEEELDLLDKYLHLQQLNASRPFTYEIQFSPELKVEEVLIPSMLLQPLVENAIVHGVKNREDGKIYIYVEKEGAALHLLIEDNGSGIPVTKNANSLHRSMSMDILKQRILVLNKTGPYQISMEISNKQMDGASQGTCVHLRISR